MSITDNIDIVYKVGELIVVATGITVAMVRTGRIIQKFEGIAERQTAEITDLKADVKELSTLIIQLTKLSGRLDLFEQRSVAEGRRIDELSTDIRQLFKNLPKLKDDD